MASVTTGPCPECPCLQRAEPVAPAWLLVAAGHVGSLIARLRPVTLLEVKREMQALWVDWSEYAVSEVVSTTKELESIHSRITDMQVRMSRLETLQDQHVTEHHAPDSRATGG